MKMQWKNVVGAVMLVGVTAVVTQQVVSQQDPPSHDDMMELWMKLAQPGEHHKFLASQEGMWDQSNTHWWEPGQPPTKSTGESKMKTIMGGRFMLQRVKSEMNVNGQMMPFEGLGIHGYDNIKKKYTYAWIDNMGTMIMLGEGTADESGTITYFSEMLGPDGMAMNIKSVSSNPSQDKNIYEMFMENPMQEDSWLPMMEIVATRRK